MLSIRKRKVILLFLAIVLIFILTTINFMSILTKFQQSEVIRTHFGIEDRIHEIYLNLPDIYYRKQTKGHLIGSEFIKYLNNGYEVGNLENLWNEANSWVSGTQLYRIDPQLGNVLFALKNAKVIKTDLDRRGSQLKFLITLEGNQEIVFKPKHYDKNEIIEGVVYAGKDRYGAEILGFYLSALLGKLMAPISVERILHFRNEILSVATENFLQTVFVLKNSTCVYGACYYCTKSDPVCEDANHSLVGAAIFNIPIKFKRYKSPWARTYKKDKLSEWQTDPSYCKKVVQRISTKRLLDIVDVSIFDFLIQNGDRHHYEVLDQNLLWLDNGKGLGNPNIDHVDILAPLYQCCQIRTNTWNRLQLLSGGILKAKLKLMPEITNFVAEAHLNALERRLLIIYATVEFCKAANKEDINIF